MASVEKEPPEITDAETDPTRQVDLDTILAEELGQLGRYQLRVVLLAGLVVVFVGWTSTEFVFTAGRIRTRCLIPECEPDGVQEFAPEWILNAVPTKDNSFDNCLRFPSVSSAANDSCPAELFDGTRVVGCEKLVYENKNTIAYDYDLGCDEWRRTLIGSARTFGLLVTLPVSGYMSDRWGRRTVLAIVVFNTAWLGVLRYWASSYAMSLIFSLIEAMLGSGGFPCAYILLMEIIGKKYRVAGGAILNSAFAISHVLLGFMAWAVPDWRNLTLCIYIPQFIGISFFWIMSESVRWLMSKGRYEESEKILKEIARVNGTFLSANSLRGLRYNAEVENRRRELQKLQPTAEPWLVVTVFRHKPVLLRCLVSPVWWITMTLIFYGLSINAVDMTGNRYINYMAVSAVEIPGYWIAVVLMNKFGRKVVLITFYWLCAACQLGYIFVSNDQYGLLLTVYLIGKCSISLVVTTLYVYTIELYPTKHRNSLLAFSSMIGRIGAILAPVTPALGKVIWDKLPFAIFGGFAFASGALVFLTPETLGSDLPDTMEQADRIGDTNDTGMERRTNN